MSSICLLQQQSLQYTTVRVFRGLYAETDNTGKHTASVFCFLCKTQSQTHMWEPSADTNIQGEMIDGGRGGVKMSGMRS